MACWVCVLACIWSCIKMWMNLQRGWFTQRSPKGLQPRPMERVLCREERYTNRWSHNVSCLSVAAIGKIECARDIVAARRRLFRIDMVTFHGTYTAHISLGLSQLDCACGLCAVSSNCSCRELWTVFANCMEIQIVSLQTEVTSILHCQCLAIDLRGHGDTKVENEADLSAETLAT